MTRIYLDRPLAAGKSVPLNPDQAHYLRHVLRLKRGDCVTVFNGSGGEYRARIERLDREHARLLVESHVQVDRDPPVRIRIFQALARGEKVEHVIQKCTELGAASFVLFVSERSQIRLSGDRLASRIRRWGRIAQEAAEQSGRTSVPSIVWQASIAELKEIPSPAFVLHPHASLAWANVRNVIACANEIGYAIGPEGGWSAADLAALENLGFQPLRFCNTILRTETTGPAITAATLAVL